MYRDNNFLAGRNPICTLSWVKRGPSVSWQVVPWLMSTLNKLYDIRGLRKAGVAKKLGVKGAGAESGEGR